MSMGKKSLVCTVAMLAGMGVAHAQEASDGGIEDIVVTAQRRAETLQSVPLQASAFSAQTIQDAGISETADFIELIPNVSFDQSFTYLNSFVVVRGVSQINNADSPVSVIVDGVPQNNQKQLRMNLFDIEQIEVLRGPQGGLYGRNAIGGAISIVTRAPGDELEGSIGGSWGTGNAFDVSGSLSTPLGANGAALRLAGSWREDGGRIDNVFLGDEVDAVDHDGEIRARFTTPLSASVNLDLRAAYRDFEAGGVYDSVVLSGDANDFQSPRENMLGVTYGDIFDASAKLDWDLGFATLTSITGYTELNETYRGDLDFSNPVDDPDGFLGLGIQLGQGQELGVRMTSQEVRLVSPDENRFRWILGAFYLHTERDLRTRGFVDLTGDVNQIDNPLLTIIDNRESNDNNAYAVYGQFDFDLTDRLTLSGALRYDEDQREQTNLVTSAVRERTFDSVQPKATLTYRFTPEALAYATYSTGFRSGGFNGPGVSIPLFLPEELTNYEIGFKTSWFNRRLIVNGAAFFAEDENFQYFFVDALSASQIIGNIDEVEISGVELEVQARLAEGFNLYAALGTTDSEIQANSIDPTSVGNRAPKTTEWSFNAGFQYEWDLTSNWRALARLDWEHQGDKYWQLDNADVQEPVDLVNLRFGVQNGDWSVFLSGRNVLDQDYYADFNPREYSGLDIDIGSLAQPQVWSIEVRRTF